MLVIRHLGIMIARRADREETPLLQALRTWIEAAFLAGPAFTAADILNLVPLTTMRVFAPRDLAPYPNERAHLQRIGERPAFQRATAKADPGFQAPLS